MKKILLLISLLLITSQAALAQTFSDVPSNHPNIEAINYLFDKNVINGYGDGTFRPDRKVNRAEALKIILLGSNINTPEFNEGEVFPDVLAGAWYAKFVDKGKKLGIVKGDSDTGLFRPSDTVNLAEALKILLITNEIEAKKPFKKPFEDVKIDAWYAPYIDYALGAGLVNKNTGDFIRPSTPITRAALSELMFRLATGKPYTQPDGKASYYGDAFQGRTTANGEKFDKNKLTAAHRTLPFGTEVKVTNLENGKSVIVRINDRGPFGDDSRVIDLSEAAFEAISPISRGVITIIIEELNAENQNNNQNQNQNTSTVDISKILNKNKANCATVSSLQEISSNFYQNINLDQSIPNRFILDEVLTIKGSSTSSEKEVTAFLVDGQGNQTATTTQKDSSGNFTLHLTFPEVGSYNLGIIAGKSGNSLIKSIEVVSSKCIAEEQDSGQVPPQNLKLELNMGETELSWDKGSYNLFKVSFIQNGTVKNQIFKEVNKFTPDYRQFKNFNEGTVVAEIRGAKISESSILRADKINWSLGNLIQFNAVTHEEYLINKEEVELSSLTEIASNNEIIRASFKPKVNIRKKAAIILPNGTVKEINIESSNTTSEVNSVGIEVFKPSNHTLNTQYTIRNNGTHFLEINNEQGLAAINIPIYTKNQYPLIPNARDLSSSAPGNLQGNLDQWRTIMLNLINTDRRKQNLASIKLDTSLNQLAQFRSDDMVKNNYFSHWDLQGNDANDLRSNFAIQTLVGENLALDINLELAQYGLMRSAIHRSNILSSDWTRAGLGISQKSDGSYIIVQIFSSDPLNLSDINNLRKSILDTINGNRLNAIKEDNKLNEIAQNWSEQMASQNFFDFVDPTGNRLVDTVRQNGINAALGTNILSNSSFQDTLKQVDENLQVQENRWKEIGIGIKQDKLGIIQITLVYTE